MSGLTPQTVQVLLGKRDTKTSQFLSTPGTLLRADNVVMEVDGELKRRTGGVALTTTGAATTNLKQIAALNGELLLFSTATGFTRLDGKAPTGNWVSKYTFGTVNMTTSEIVGAVDGNDQRSHDFVRAGGYDWHVYELQTKTSITDSSSIVLAIYNTATRALIAKHIIAQTTASPKPSRPSIYVSGTDIIVAYVNVTVAGNNETTPTTLVAHKFSTASPTTFGGAVTVDTLYAGVDVNGLGGAYDGQVRAGSIIAFAYKVAGAVFGSRVRIREWNITTMATSTTSNSADITATVQGDIADTAFGFLTNLSGNSNWYVASVASCTVGARNCINLHSVQHGISGAVTLTTIATSNGYGGAAEGFRNVTGYVDSAVTAHIFAESRSDGPVWPTPVAGSRTAADRYTRYYTYTAAAVLTNQGQKVGFGLGSRPWVIMAGATALIHMLFTYTSSIAPTYLVMRSTSIGDVKGRTLTSTAGLMDTDTIETGTNARLYRPTRCGRLPMPQMSGEAATIAAYRMGANSSPGSPAREAVLVGFSPSVFAGRAVNVVDSLAIPGGPVCGYDGKDTTALSAIGFHLSPEGIQNVALGGGGSFPNNTNYRYAYCYAYVDLKGRFHVSAPSPEYSINTGASTAISLDFPIYKAAINSAHSYQILVFRTDGNPQPGDPLFFRYSVSATSGTFAAQYLDLGNQLTPGEELYTQNGDVLNNTPLPPMSFLWQWGNRMWGIFEENRKAFAFTKLIKDGYGLEYNATFFGIIDDEYGPLYGGCSLGEQNVLFKENAVYLISGDGPDDTNNGRFSEPRRLDGVPGCKEPNTIILTAAGVMYRGPDKNIWLLRFDGSSHFVGRRISDLTAGEGPYSAAVYDEVKQHVHFFNPSTAQTHVYDIQTDQWYRHTGQAAISAIYTNGAVHYLTSSNIVQATAGVYTEAGATYQATIELAWLSLGEVQGYKRVWDIAILGRQLGSANLSAQMIADFGTKVATRSISLSVPPLLAEHFTRVNAKVPLSLQQNTSLRLGLSDNSPDTAGWAIAALRLQCGFDSRRMPRLPASHRMT